MFNIKNILAYTFNKIILRRKKLGDINLKKMKFGFSFKGTILILLLSSFVTYFYFKDTTVLTFGRVESLPIYRVGTDEKKIAITFDVNWGDDNTNEILKILDKHNAKATFFLIGKWIDYSEQNVELVKDMDKYGHEIGNHSNLHPGFIGLSRERIIKELEITDSKIYKLTNKRSKLFRFPRGEYDRESVDIVKSLGYIPIQWDVDSVDWKEDGKEIEYERISKKSREGSIILFHNNTKYTPENLDKFLNEFKNQGYEFVKVSDLIYNEDYEIDITGEQKIKKHN